MQRYDFNEGGAKSGEKLRRIAAAEIPWKAGDAVALDSVERAQDGTFVNLEGTKTPPPGETFRIGDDLSFQTMMPFEEERTRRAFTETEGFLVEDVREGHVIKLTRSEEPDSSSAFLKLSVQRVYRDDEHHRIFLEMEDGEYFLLRSLGQKHEMPSRMHLEESLHYDTHFADAPVADVAGADEDMLVTQCDVREGLRSILNGSVLQTVGADAHGAPWRQEQPPDTLTGEEQAQVAELLLQLQKKGSQAAKELIFRQGVHTPHNRTRSSLDAFTGALQTLQYRQQVKLDRKRGMSRSEDV